MPAAPRFVSALFSVWAFSRPEPFSATCDNQPWIILENYTIRSHHFGHTEFPLEDV
jgi:hypothetical protein